TARMPQGVREPLRVIVDSRGRTPLQAGVLTNPARALIVTTSAMPPSRTREYSLKGVEVMEVPAVGGQVDLRELLGALGQRGITSVLAEGGGSLLGSLFDLGLVDKTVAFIAPIVIGGKEAVTPVAGRGVESVSEALRLKRVRMERFGDDIMVVGYTG
ncbi:MAG: riboflavin biosynthesis protein RibD, partial [Chloroflexi bacterium]|nr:riboflavin biosynthesis protein RibD [Chloroflexota bacterium]